MKNHVPSEVNLSDSCEYKLIWKAYAQPLVLDLFKSCLLVSFRSNPGMSKKVKRDEKR